jgi:DNA-binding response OmpR family regulator
VTSRSAQPPPLVLMIYASDGGGYGQYLLGNGFRVAEAQTGEQGFEQAVTLLPDLIVLDFGLNSDLVARLRCETTTRAIPIIALTDISALHERGAGRARPPEGGAGS